MKQIYLHGLGQSPKSWERTVAQLKSAEYSVCPDLARMVRGGQATYKNLYAAFKEECDKIREPFDICGLSLGGVLALNYAVEYPERVRSLVLIGTQYKMPERLLKFQNMLFRLMPRSMFLQTGFGKSDFLRICQSMMELDFSGSLKNVSCPVLVVCGEKDRANKKAAQELAEGLDNAVLEIIGKAGHEVNTEAPEKLAEVIRAFYAVASDNFP